MEIRVKLMASFRNKLPPGSKGGQATLDVPPHATIHSVLQQLTIDTSHVHLVMLNGAAEADRAKTLAEGDEITVFPPVAGG